MSEGRPKKSGFKRFLRPRMPRIQRDGLSTLEELRALRENLAPSEFNCPNDGRPLELHNVFETNSNGDVIVDGIVTRILGCDCGYQMPIEPIVQAARQELGAIKTAERQMFFLGALIVIIFGVLAYMNGTLATLLGGLVFALALFIRGLLFRYRHWQINNERMFESKAPVRDWLRHEWLS